MKSLLIFLLLFVFTSTINAQTYFSRSGKITFFSKAPVENIEATNNDVTSILDTKKGEFAFIALIKSFKFKKALMQEHFNENYMESNTFPKANFKGAIIDLSKVNFSKDGSYPVTVKGDLTIHGVTKNITTPGSVSVSEGKLTASSKFNIQLKDYKIKRPAAVINSIAETIIITVDCKYDPYKKG